MQVANPKTAADRPTLPRLTFSVYEVADLLGISHWTVRRGIERGDIMSVRICGRRLIPKTEVDRLTSVNSAL